MTLLLRTASDPTALAGPAKRWFGGSYAGIAPYSVTTLRPSARRLRFPPARRSQLLGLFGVLGLLLASIGLYGVLSFQVARRTREIGIRMALGSSRREVMGLVLRQGALLVGLGLAIGIVAAAGMAQLLRSLLLGLHPWDPLAFAGVLAALVVASSLACLVPARRATRVDPLVALRHE